MHTCCGILMTLVLLPALPPAAAMAQSRPAATMAQSRPAAADEAYERHFVACIPLGMAGRALDVTVSPRDSRGWICTSLPGAVVRVDTITAAVSGTFGTLVAPQVIRYGPSGEKLYVVAQADQRGGNPVVRVFDART
ncbi:hypothetical protein LCGC14_1807300, partial [marine sediment metagenome]